MAIERMDKIRLMAVSSQRDEILRELMLLGCVEITDPAAAPEDAFLEKLTRYDGADLSRCKSDHAMLMNGLKLLDKYAPEKKKFLSPLPETEIGALLDESGVPGCLAVAEKLGGLDEQIRRMTAEESRERSVIESLQPWQDLSMPLDCRGTERAAAILGTLPASLEQAEADGVLSAACERAALLRVSSDKNLHYVCLICLREEQETVLAALRPLGFLVMNLGELRGTAAENTAAAAARLSLLAERKKKCAEDIAAEAGRRKALELRADTLSTKIAKAEAAAKLLCTESTFVFQGWLLAANRDRLAEALAKYDCAWETEDPDPEEYPQVPVKLKNGRFSRPLNMVTEMYSLPAYDGVDPNPLMAPFFILFYGLMLADVAYGLIMIAAALLVLKKKKPSAGTRNFFELMFVCGISTFFGGLITGGFFGNLIPTVTETFFGLSADQLPVWLQKFNEGLLFNPLDDTIYVLIGAMALGFIQIMTGMIINFVETTKSGHFWDALMDQGSWWLVFVGVAVGALTGFWWVAVAGAAALVLTQGRAKPTLIGKLVGGIASLYNVTGYFGDILSYSRIMALMLAGSVIAQVFNTLGAIPGNIIVFILIFIVGHTLNFGLNLLGCYVHDLRLQCLEYFGKFYKDGGRAFSPLNIKIKYHSIAE